MKQPNAAAQPCLRRPGMGEAVSMCSAYRSRIKPALAWMQVLAAMSIALGVVPLYAAEPIEVPIHPSERALEAPALQPEKAPGGFELPPVAPTPPEAPATAETVQVDAIAFEGNQVISTEALLGIAHPF